VVTAATGVAAPCSVAELLVRLMVPLVTTTGLYGIVNDRTDPNAVPEALVTMAQK
jgi:hypothetical protein